MTDDKRSPANVSTPAGAQAASAEDRREKAAAVGKVRVGPPVKSHYKFRQLPVKWGVSGEVEHGPPPVNADGIALPPPTRRGTLTVLVTSNDLYGTWLFVAVPQSGGATAQQCATFFAAIVLNRLNDLDGTGPFTPFPPALQGETAKVAGNPPASYPLANYWVALYYLANGDSFQFPTKIAVPAGLVSWVQNVSKKAVVLKKKKSPAVSDPRS
jgi:hypothetical protein